MPLPPDPDDGRDLFAEIERSHSLDYGQKRPQRRVARSLFILLGGFGLLLIAVAMGVLFLVNDTPSDLSFTEQISYFFSALVGSVPGSSVVVIITGWAGLGTILIALLGLYGSPHDPDA